MPDNSLTGENVLQGIPVSAGVCQGRVLVLTQDKEAMHRRAIMAGEVGSEMARLEKALVETRRQILDVQHQLTNALGAEEASIFEAHLLVLEDQMLIEQVGRLVTKDLVNVEYAMHKVAEDYINSLNAIEDEYLRERAKDMQDVTERILNNLTGRPDKNHLPSIKEPSIIISHDLTPSVTAGLERKMALGFATDVGSKTSHTAILARSLGIPAVVGLRNASLRLKNGNHVLLDGFNGVLIVNPSDQTLFEYGQLIRRKLSIHEKLNAIKDKPAITIDGHQVTLSANVQQAADTQAVQDNGAEGVGLFRTEYLFINRDTQPTEEEQYEAYRQVASALKPQDVIIRTLDIGGDKFVSHIALPLEMNPFLGWRAIRFCLQEKEIFRRQIRAILRASVEGNIKMMYPMICRMEELIQANALVEECRAQLKAENIRFNPDLEIGMMIETPSAALISESLAPKVDFFSLGTNDLIQYTLAVDRLNEKIAHLYEPTHPAILQLIKRTVESAHKHGIWAGVCGEMAGDIELVPLLVGLGVDELSVSPSLIPQVKYLIRCLKHAKTVELADYALQSGSGSEILVESRNMAMLVAPALFESSTQQ